MRTTVEIKISKTALQLIDELCEAAEALAFKGAAHPDAHAEIEQRYENARGTLGIYISELEAK